MGTLLELKQYIIQYIKCLKKQQPTVTGITVSDLIGRKAPDVSVVGLGTLFEAQSQRNLLLQKKVWVFESESHSQTWQPSRWELDT